MLGSAEARERVLGLLAEHGVLSSRRLADEAIPRYVLGRMVDDGLIERVGRGYYGAVDRDDLGATRVSAIAEALGMSKGSTVSSVLCCGTAAVIHRLTTDNRIDKAWIAVPRDARRLGDTVAGLPCRWVVMRPELLYADVAPVEFGGREVMATTRERTIVDMLRMSKVQRVDGLPVVPFGEGMDCLRKGLSDGVDPGDLARIAHEIPRAKWIAQVVAETVAETAVPGHGI